MVNMNTLRTFEGKLLFFWLKIFNKSFTDFTNEIRIVVRKKYNSLVYVYM